METFTLDARLFYVCVCVGVAKPSIDLLQARQKPTEYGSHARWISIHGVLSVGMVTAYINCFRSLNYKKYNCLVILNS